MAPSLLGLPNELLSKISECLEDDQEIQPLHALTLTSRHLSAIASPILYRYAVKQLRNLPLLWAAKFGNLGTLEKALARINQASNDWRNQSSEYWAPKPFLDRHVSNPYSTREWDMDYPATGPAPENHDSDSDSDFAEDSAFVDTGSEVETELASLDAGELAWGYSDDDSGSLAEYDAADLEFNALHIAVKEGHVETTRILLDKGVNIDSRCRHVCACMPAPTVLDTTMSPKRPDFKAMHFIPLHLAICSSRPEVAKLLISRSASILEPLPDALPVQVAVFHLAAARGYVDLLKHMLDVNPNIDVDAHNPQVFNSSLSGGANINVQLQIPFRDSLAITTPLGEACHVGRFGDALKLIELGADITVPFIHIQERASTSLRGFGPGNSFYTRIPLIHLCLMKRKISDLHRRLNRVALRQKKHLRQLIAKLISLDAPQHWVRQGLDEDGQEGPECDESPLSLALWRGYHVVLEALRDSAAAVDAIRPLNPGLGQPADEPDVLHRILQMLLRASADPLVRNNQGISAFEIAVDQRLLFALAVFARQGNIDISSVFSQDVISDMLYRFVRNKRANPADEAKYGCYSHCHAYKYYRRDPQPALSLLLDMDRQKLLTSTPHFLIRCLKRELGPNLAWIFVCSRNYLEASV
ncbi:ankyrin repeat-containing domain protein [Podospora fimiseda]|uniref:Ankyrin repeat-containing domain protein n=1 Tax=Podospora fimiseda TaxID=252190 RepID=A0AAN6YQG0_9PEZI|nr:ankyrin repeat-containing domain protein [Podospora fimiseda]